MQQSKGEVGRTSGGQLVTFCWRSKNARSNSDVIKMSLVSIQRLPPSNSTMMRSFIIITTTNIDSWYPVNDDDVGEETMNLMVQEDNG